MNIPIELFLGFIAMTFMLIVIGIVRKPNVPVLVVTAGLFIITISVITDNIVLGQKQISEIENTIIPLDVTHMNQQVSNSNNALRGGSTIFSGEEVVNINSILYGKEVNYVQVRLYRVGSPTGTGYVGIWNSISDTNTPTLANAKFIIGQFESSQLTTSTTKDTSFLRNDTKTWILDSNEAVGLLFTGGSAGNTVNIEFNSVDVFDTTNSQRTTASSTSWTDGVGDTRGMIKGIGVNVQENKVNTFDEDSNLYQFTQIVKVLFSFFGAMLMLIGALMTRIE